jgi:hypothetical protein
MSRQELVTESVLRKEIIYVATCKCELPDMNIDCTPTLRTIHFK